MDIERKIRDFILTELAYDKSDLTLANDTSLIDDGIVDSIGVLKLMIYIEAEFGFKIAPKDYGPASFETIGAIRDLVTRYVPALRG